MASRRRKTRRRKGNIRRRGSIDPTTAPGVGSELVIVRGPVHLLAGRGMTTRVRGVHPALILVILGGDPLHIRLKTTTVVGQVAAPTIPSDGEDQTTMCGNGHGPTSPTRFPPEGILTDLDQATTTGNDSGAKVHPGGHRHRRGRGLAHPPQRLKNPRKTAPHGWLQCHQMRQRCQASARNT